MRKNVLQSLNITFILTKNVYVDPDSLFVKVPFYGKATRTNASTSPHIDHIVGSKYKMKLYSENVLLNNADIFITFMLLFFFSGLQIRVRYLKLFSFKASSQPNICCGCSKEPSQ